MLPFPWRPVPAVHSDLSVVVKHARRSCSPLKLTHAALHLLCDDAARLLLCILLPSHFLCNAGALASPAQCCCHAALMLLV